MIAFVIVVILKCRSGSNRIRKTTSEPFTDPGVSGIATEGKVDDRPASLADFNGDGGPDYTTSLMMESMACNEYHMDPGHVDYRTTLMMETVPFTEYARCQCVGERVPV